MSTGEDFPMTIDGQAVASAAMLDVVNPATEAIIARAPDAARPQLDACVAAARRAFPGWRDTPIESRKAALVKAAEVLKAHAEELARLLTQEQGKPLAAAMQEVMGSAIFLQAYAALDLPVEVREESEARRVEVRRVPLGVVAAIVPWNFPVILAIWKIGPALLAGNTVVLKPSPYTPLTALKIGRLLGDVFPPGVLNVISGGDALGPMITAHPGIAKVSFTGSTVTGRRVMSSASATLKRVTLELGGNDAAIVMPDVDIDRLARPIFNSAFVNSGQTCIATKRLYIHEDVYGRLRDKLAEIAREVVVGAGEEPESILGPIQNKRQFDRVKDLLQDARDRGLTLIEGRAPASGTGYFVPVTLVDNPPDDARVVTEEAFGPVLPLLKFNDVEEVIARANDTDFGLAGVVWSGDQEQGVKIAERLETGTVWINEHYNMSPLIPLGGHKQSGIGVENGREGLLEYTNTQVFHIAKDGAAAG
ncbi:MAG: aldehyde dehydrogenase family protein [Sphingomonadales bacterium]|nr:aldehyde dehydrogenase family protein [Sphingomonadales bacterium]